MRITVFSSKSYDRTFLQRANAGERHQLVFLEARLDADTVALAKGSGAVCVFVNDHLDEEVLAALFDLGVRLIALRCAGFNNVDVAAAERLGLTVVRVPAYSPHAVAEHALALLLALNRHLHKAYNRVREGNFALSGLMGFDLYGKTVGVVGAGKIGGLFARMVKAMGCEVLLCDPQPDDSLQGVGQFVDWRALCEQSDVISLHCPLTPDTHHLVSQQSLGWMKPGVVLINTSRGPIIDTRAVIQALKAGHLGHLGLDVYEEEGDLFFADLSATVIQDDVFARLLTFPNVLITGHQGFFTHEALTAIADTTLANIEAFASGDGEIHRVTAQHLA
jgi:D-lactate dehydrogenase